MQAQPAATPLATPETTYPDRSTGLTIFGIIEIVFAGFSLLMVPFMLLSAAMSRKIAGGGLPAGSYVASICTYSFLAFGLITLGIGSIGARRWARALNLLLAWAGLVFGIIVIVVMLVVLPSSFMAAFRQAAATTPNSPPVSTGVVAVILTLMIVFFSVVFVIVPLAFLLFFRRKDVEETCKRRDPVERWTDRVPLPVLGMSLLLGFGGIYSLLLALTTPMLPFFGRYLTGWHASVGLVLGAALNLFLAYAFYRLRPLGWWIAVGALLLRVISAAMTYAHDDLLRAYSKMGWSQTQVDMMRNNPALRHTGILWSSVAMMFVVMGYLLWIKRYFKAPAPDPISEITSPAGIASQS